MSQRTPQSISTRPTRRHERRDGHDIADIYESRLLAQGMRSDDFITLRSSTDLPSIPNIKPVRFGRGVEPTILPPIAEESAASDSGETVTVDAETGNAATESD
ncbi:MAG: hypothetical protein IT337_08650 [Thermomicrobiales bacterium]|nr:hypothetical protein [Thermomicrobiales bacterium]